MKCPYEEMTKEELKVIYNDIILSESIPQRAETLVPYGMQIRDNIGVNFFTLREGIDRARQDFFEEIAKRFFYISN